MPQNPDSYNQRPAGIVEQFVTNRDGFGALVEAKDPNRGLLAWEAAFMYCSKDDALTALNLEVLGHGFEFRRVEVPDEEAERTSNEFRFNIAYGYIHDSLFSELSSGRLLAAGFSQGSANANKREFIRPERWVGLNLQIFRSEATAEGATISNLLIFPRTAPMAQEFLRTLDGPDPDTSIRSVPEASPRLSEPKLKRWVKNALEPACVELGVRLNVELAVKLSKETYSKGVTHVMMRSIFRQASAIKNRQGRPRAHSALPSEEQLDLLRQRLLASPGGLDGSDRKTR